jgi:hypothetical protein
MMNFILHDKSHALHRNQKIINHISTKIISFGGTEKERVAKSI